MLTFGLRPCGPVPCPGSCSTTLEETATAPSPKCPRVPFLQADGDVIQPTPPLSLPLTLQLPAGQEMLSHSKALCLAPQTQQQWEVLKMLLLKLFSVLTLKRDEKSLMNCRIYKIVLLYCSACQSAEQKYFVLNPRTLECNAVEAMLPDPQTFIILQNQISSSWHKPLVPTNSGEESKSACKKKPWIVQYYL